METTTEKPRRYSRRVLRGRIPVAWSTRVTFPKLHVDPRCEALENTPEEAVGSERMNAREIAACEWGRPCRMCSLESVLNTLLNTPCPHDGPGDDHTRFVTFTSQSNPRSPDQPGGPYAYQWHASTDSGRRRLLRVAAKAGLQVTHSACGPVAYGFVPADAVPALAQNLRTYCRDHIDEMPSADLVAYLWALLGDNPPELDFDGDGLDAWDIASRLSR